MNTRNIWISHLTKSSKIFRRLFYWNTNIWIYLFLLTLIVSQSYFYELVLIITNVWQHHLRRYRNQLNRQRVEQRVCLSSNLIRNKFEVTFIYLYPLCFWVIRTNWILNMQFLNSEYLFMKPSHFQNPLKQKIPKQLYFPCIWDTSKHVPIWNQSPNSNG